MWQKNKKKSKKLKGKIGERNIDPYHGCLSSQASKDSNCIQKKNKVKEYEKQRGRPSEEVINKDILSLVELFGESCEFDIIQLIYEEHSWNFDLAFEAIENIVNSPIILESQKNDDDSQPSDATDDPQIKIVLEGNEEEKIENFIGENEENLKERNETEIKFKE
jgi:hypothetical protein